ncbi:MAG: CopG family transcriptional regulator [Bryobacteraceae bacterium]
MSIRTTVTLDEDVLERVKAESRAKGISFRDALNELLRQSLSNVEQPRPRTLMIVPKALGFPTGLNHDSVASLMEYGEGEQHR